MSTHGYSQNQIIVWKHPTMTKLATLTGHTFRVLYLAVSPDGQTIVTGAGERVLCWGSGACLAGGHAGAQGRDRVAPLQTRHTYIDGALLQRATPDRVATLGDLCDRSWCCDEGPQ